MNNLDKQYTSLLQDILDNGVSKMDRTGTGTISVFGRQIRHKMREGFPLLTTKKMAWKTMVTELLWFLRGDTNIKFLVDNGCHIWDGDAYKNYCKNADEGTFSRKWLKLEESFDGFFTNEEYSLYTQEEFINKIKTDTEFSEKWGLVIEERELSLEERLDLLKKLEIFQERAIDNAKSEMIHSLAVSHNIPTKQLTITYNDKTITYNVKTIETYE